MTLKELLDIIIPLITKCYSLSTINNDTHFTEKIIKKICDNNETTITNKDLLDIIIGTIAECYKINKDIIT